MLHSSLRCWIPGATMAWLMASACGGPESFHRVGDDASVAGGSGGQTLGTGGDLQAPSGTGGKIAGSGGETAGSGGAPGSGGAKATGGVTGTGGRVASGGMVGASGGGPAASGGQSGGGGGSGTGGGTVGGAGSSGRAGAPATSALMDDFEQGAGRWMGGDPSDWTVVTDGTTRVYKQGALSNVVRTVSAGSGQWSDLTVEARVKVLDFGGQSTSYQAIVCGRFKDRDNYYYAALDSTGKLSIKKNTTVTSHLTLTSTAAQIVVARWYTVKLQISGNTLTAFLDGALKLTATDRDLSTGSVGLGTRNATAEFAAVRVTSP